MFLSGLSLLGCGGGMGSGSSDSGTAIARDDAALEFGSRAELHAWLADKADELGLSDVVVHRNAKSEIESLVMSRASRDALFSSLFATLGHFELEGHEIALSSNATNAPILVSPELGESPVRAGVKDVSISTRASSGIPSSQTNCAGSFCVTGSSWNDHYSLFGFGYHDVGGDVSAPGIVTSYPAINVAPNTCGTRIGCSAPVWSCSSGDQLVVTQQRTSWGTVTETDTCLHTVGYAGVSNTYFSNTNDCGSGHCQNVPMAINTYTAMNSGYASASQSLTAIGYFTLPCTNGFGPAECYVDGVCSSQFAMGPGGSASTRTAAGSYDCQ